MSERFRPEAPKSPEQEREEFIREETEAFRRHLIASMEASGFPSELQARQLKELKEVSEEKLFGQLFNNLSGWLPRSEHGGSIGMYRTPDLMKMRKGERKKRAAALMKDVDAFLKENRYEAFLEKYTEQVAELQKMINEAFLKKLPLRNVVEKKLVSDEEVLEFQKKLWFAMRKKGYTKEELRT